MRARFTPIALALAVIAAPALADDYAEFRIPDHSTTFWNLSGEANASRSLINQGPASGRTAGGLGSGSTRYSHIRIGDRRFVSLDAGLGLMGSLGSMQDRTLIASSVGGGTEQRGHRWDQRSGEDLYLNVSERRWLGESRFALQASISSMARFTQWKSNQDSRFVTSDGFSSTANLQEADRRNFTNDRSVIGSVGIGMGHVRDASAVHAMHILESRLRETGAISRELSSEARQKLVALIVESGAMSGIEDRPGPLVWRAIESVLRDDGALAEGGVSGESVMRSGEPFVGAGRISSLGLPLTPVTRLHGQWVAFRAGGEHRHSLSLEDRRQQLRFYMNDSLVAELRDSNALTTHDTRDFLTAGLEAEWHRPAGDRWQWDAWARVDRSLRKEEPMSEVSESFRANWLVAERWVATLGVDHIRRIEDIGSERSLGISLWEFSEGIDITWFARNAWAISLLVRDEQRHYRDWVDTAPSARTDYRRNGYFRLGVTYRLRGSMRAPDVPAFAAAGARPAAL